MTSDDAVNPKHYKGAIECIQVIEQLECPFDIGNVIKYVWRYNKKNGLEDLKKARWYLDHAIRRIEGNDARI